MMSFPESHPGVNHLTPEVLAAWIDGQLSAEERSAAEVHAADCAQCQAMLAVMARTAATEPSRERWRWASLRWLVPAAAAMTVFAIWLGVDRNQQDAPQTTTPETAAAQQAVREVAPAPPVEPKVSVTDSIPSAATAKREGGERLTRSSGSVERRERAQAKAADSAANQDRVDAIAPNAAVAGSPPPPASAASTAPAPQPFAGVAQSALPPSTPAAGAPAGAARGQPNAAPRVEGVAESVTITTEAPGLADAAQKSAARGAARFVTSAVEVVSPERAYRWRAVTPGSVQYSMDSGTNWRSSSTGTAVALRAGSAPSRTVCWLVGQAGTVLLTTDGQTWQVRPFPERIDLTAVEARDARTATVTTADRRRFATADGGATWSPLQEN
jgi:hypothetical protein